jgi:tricorn protease-like protein
MFCHRLSAVAESNRRAFLGCLAGFALTNGVIAQPPSAADELRTYANTLEGVQADLAAGKNVEAVKKLESTDKSIRGFEFDYLLARASAPASGSGAPDLVKTVKNPAIPTRYGLLNPVTRRLVFICQDGALRIHDFSKPDAEPKTVSHSGGAVWSGAFSHDGKTFAAGYDNGDVVVWDAETWKPKTTVSLGEKSPVREIAVAPDGSAFVAESKTGLELWSVAGGTGNYTKIAKVGERYNFGEGLAFSPKGDRVVTGGMFDILVYDAKSGEKKSAMRHASYTMGLAISPDGKNIASAPRGNVNKFLGAFNMDGGGQAFNAGPFAGYILNPSFSPDGKRIVATGAEKKLRVFDTDSGAILLTIDRPSVGAMPTFSRDGRLLGWSEADGYQYIDLGSKPSGGT